LNGFAEASDAQPNDTQEMMRRAGREASTPTNMKPQPTYNRRMTAGEVVEIIQLFEQNQIDVCIDGGWGVDALLGEQTRPHADLDIAIQHKDVAQVRALLAARGYKDVPCDGTWECNFVLGDDQGRQVDIHSYTFDAAGNHVSGVAYPFDSLTGTGSINGYAVNCISPDWAVKFHTGYAVDADDYRDVRALCQRFGIEMPLEYEIFATTDNVDKDSIGA
jgi:lincosamide nucleotidyltransferase A/C/D/E